MGNRRKPRNPTLTGRIVPEKGIAEVGMAADGKIIVKTVPAKVDGEVVGFADIYEDGTVGVTFNERVSEAAQRKVLDILEGKNGMAGYSVGTD